MSETLRPRADDGAAVAVDFFVRVIHFLVIIVVALSQTFFRFVIAVGRSLYLCLFDPYIRAPLAEIHPFLAGPIAASNEGKDKWQVSPLCSQLTS